MGTETLGSQGQSWRPVHGHFSQMLFILGVCAVGAWLSDSDPLKDLVP